MVNDTLFVNGTKYVNCCIELAVEWKGEKPERE
jgi:hypothetical protein